jgi:hypothetical protein
MYIAILWRGVWATRLDMPLWLAYPATAPACPITLSLLVNDVFLTQAQVTAGNHGHCYAPLNLYRGPFSSQNGINGRLDQSALVFGLRS